MTLTTDEFIRRFLLHVLPRGFHRIRHYGLLASGNRRDNLARARELLAEFVSARDNRPVDPDRLYLVSSSSQAYAWLTKLLCDPGDALLAPRPGYPLVESLAALESVAISPITRLLRPVCVLLQSCLPLASSLRTVVRLRA